MDLHLLVTLGAILIVFGYQFVMWLRRGVDPPQGTRVIRYEPPRGLSPALMRYIWKQDFDDRGLWAAALNLVAKGLLVIETKDGVSSFTAPPAAPANNPETGRPRLRPANDQQTTATTTLTPRTGLASRGIPAPSTRRALEAPRRAVSPR